MFNKKIKKIKMNEIKDNAANKLESYGDGTFAGLLGGLLKKTKSSDAENSSKRVKVNGTSEGSVIGLFKNTFKSDKSEDDKR